MRVLWVIKYNFQKTYNGSIYYRSIKFINGGEVRKYHNFCNKYRNYEDFFLWKENKYPQNGQQLRLNDVLDDTNIYLILK